METRLEFKGTGGELFGKLIVGAILTGITFGIYLPWFMVELNKYIYSKTSLRPAGGSEMQLEFTGKGGELFKIGLVGALLTSITLGIYFPWFIVNLTRFYQDNSTAKGAGLTYRLKLDLTGGQLFKEIFVGYLLAMVTFGIYLPWLMCKLQRLFADKTTILANERPAGTMAFRGQGGDLFVVGLVGYLLTLITLGIYMPWFQVKLLKFFSTNTEVTVNGRMYTGDFLGSGGDYFVTMLVGYLLTVITMGIYGFWFLAKLLKFQLDNTVYRLGSAQAQSPVVASRVA